MGEPGSAREAFFVGEVRVDMALLLEEGVILRAGRLRGATALATPNGVRDDSVVRGDESSVVETGAAAGGRDAAIWASSLAVAALTDVTAGGTSTSAAGAAADGAPSEITRCASSGADKDGPISLGGPARHHGWCSTCRKSARDAGFLSSNCRSR